MNVGNKIDTKEKDINQEQFVYKWFAVKSYIHTRFYIDETDKKNEKDKDTKSNIKRDFIGGFDVTFQ